MIKPDLVNGCFEFSGGFVLLLNVRQLIKDKNITGISLIPVIFFSIWGLWKLYYYPNLEQWLSFIGGIFLFIVDLIWLGLAIYYWYKFYRR